VLDGIADWVIGAVLPHKPEMPELPEVETIRNELSPWVVGQSFTEVTISDAKVACGCSAKEVRRGLIGQKVDKLGRRGKYLIFHLSNGNALIIHLRMTGSLLLDPEKMPTISGQPFASPTGIASSSATGGGWEKCGWSTMRMLWSADWVPSRSIRGSRRILCGRD